MEQKPILRYVSLNRAYCTLTTDTRAQIMRKHGTNNVNHIRNATEDDIVNVRSMGGYIPDGRVAK